MKQSHIKQTKSQLTTVEKNRLQSASQYFIKGGTSFYQTYFNQVNSMSISTKLKQKMQNILKGKQKELQQSSQNKDDQQQKTIKQSNNVFSLIFLLGVGVTAGYLTFKQKIDNFIKIEVPKIRKFFEMFCSDDVSKLMSFITEHKLLDRLAENMSNVWTDVSGLLMSFFKKINDGFSYFLNGYNDYYQDNIFVFLFKKSIEAGAKRIFKQITLFSVLGMYVGEYKIKLELFPDLQQYVKYGGHVVKHMKQVVIGARQSTGSSALANYKGIFRVTGVRKDGRLEGQYISPSLRTSWAAVGYVNVKSGGKSGTVPVHQFIYQNGLIDTVRGKDKILEWRNIATDIIQGHYKNIIENTPKQFNIDNKLARLPNPKELKPWKDFQNYWDRVRATQIKMSELPTDYKNYGYVPVCRLGYYGDDSLFNTFVELKQQFENSKYSRFIPIQWKNSFFYNNLDKIYRKYQRHFDDIGATAGERSMQVGNNLYGEIRYQRTPANPFNMWHFGMMLYLTTLMVLMKHKFDLQLAYQNQAQSIRKGFFVDQDGKKVIHDKSFLHRLNKSGKQYKSISASFIGKMVSRVLSGSISGQSFLDWVIDNKNGFLSLKNRILQSKIAFIQINDNIQSTINDNYDVYYHRNGMISLIDRLSQIKYKRNLNWIPENLQVYYIRDQKTGEISMVNVSYTVLNFTNMGDLENMNSDVDQQTRKIMKQSGYKSQMSLVVGIVQGYHKVVVDHYNLVLQRKDMLIQLRNKLKKLKQ